MKYAKKIFLTAICLAIFVFFTWLCLEDLFSDIALEQMLWHIKNAELLAEGYTSELIILRYLLTIIFYIILACIVFLFDKRIAAFISIHLKLQTLIQERSVLRCFYGMEIGGGMLALFYLGHFIPEIWQIARMQLFPDTIAESQFIAKHMDLSASSKLSFPAGKNNLVCILVESMEDSFESYIPNLNKLREEGISNNNMQTIYGTNWTIAAQTAWHFGLPLKTPLGINRNRYISRDGFLPNAVSIFDILAHNGYKCVLIMGTDAVFGGTELLFTRHGNFEIRDKKYFRDKGYDLSANQGTEWGLSDKFVLNMALEAYSELVEGTDPFVLFVSTMDTHSPIGYAEPEDRQFGDIRDAIMSADRNVVNFVQKILNIPHKDDKLALCVIGDHEYMGRPDFLKTAKQRRIYNFFTGELPALPEAKINMALSALDIAPTLLHMTGAQWPGGKFGLGVSLFSDEPSLLHSLGPEKLNDALTQRSKFYEKLY